jgi:hypothetical protein
MGGKEGQLRWDRYVLRIIFFVLFLFAIGFAFTILGVLNTNFIVTAFNGVFILYGSVLMIAAGRRE